MSYITCQSNPDLSSDRARLVNTYKNPLKVKKNAEVGLTSLSFQKNKQYQITTGENDTFYLRLCEEGDKQFGQKFKAVIPSGVYTGDELATQIINVLDTFPLANWSFPATYDDKTEKFAIGCIQVRDTVNTLNMVGLVDPQTGETAFTNNGTSEVDFTATGWTTSTSFYDLVPDAMCVSTSQIFPDGTQTNGTDDTFTGGHFTMEVQNQSGSTGYGAQKLGITGYWNMNNSDTNTRPVIDGSKSLIDLTIKDNLGGGTPGTSTLISLDIMPPDRSINAPAAGWEGTMQNVFSDVDVTNLSSIKTGLVDWTTFAYTFDAIYASIEINRECEVTVWLWHDTGLDGSVQEKQAIATSGDTNFPFMLKQHHYPLLGTCAKTSGNNTTNTQSVVKLSGLFSQFPKSNSKTPLGSEISGILDTSELLQNGLQGELEVSNYNVFGEIYASDNLPVFDSNVQGNTSFILGMDRFISQPFSDTHSIVSSEKGASSIINHDIQVEIEDFNIKGLRATTKSIAKIIAVIPAEELNVNSDTGVVHYHSSTPIMVSLNLENDYVINNLTMSLRAPDGRLHTDFKGETNASLFVK